MGPRATIAAGLGAGALTAIILLVALVVFLPDPGIPATPGETLPGAPGSSAPAPTPGGTSPAGPGTGAATVEPTEVPRPFHVGEPAPAIVVPQLGGGEIDLASLRGKPVWVAFMATWCSSCRDEFPRMSGFAARYAETGLVVLAIDVGEDEATVDAFVREVGAAFPVGLDADGSVTAGWDAIALPVHFWVDRDGIIRAGALGGIGPDIMAENLRTILPGVEVTP